jgi:hypothetical protein
MKIATENTSPSMRPSPGEEAYGWGDLHDDFAAYEISGSEEGVELKTYAWMQRQTNGPMDSDKTERAITGWRMRMRREFLEWGNNSNLDCWDYIPVGLREWRDVENPIEKWRETPALFLWRCYLWQWRLRGCRERKPRQDVKDKWESYFGWIYGPIDNWIAPSNVNGVSFEIVPADVAEFLTRDWLVRLENPLSPPIWDKKKNNICDVEFNFGSWLRPENWVPSYTALMKELQDDRKVWLAMLRGNPKGWIQCPDSLKNDEEVINARKNGWIELLKWNVNKWNQCPKLLQKDEDVIEARKTAWFEKCKRDPIAWNRCPTLLQTDFRHDPTVLQCLKAGWVNLFKDDPQQWNSCPAFLQEDEEVANARKSGWIKLLKLNINKWDQCPKLLQNDEDVIEARTTGWIEKFKHDPMAWNRCPDFLQTDLLHDPKVVQYLRVSWGNLLKDEPQKWNSCPSFLQTDEVIIKSSWIEKFKRDPMAWNRCPSLLQTDFRHDSKVVQDLRASWVNLLKRDPEQWNSCPAFLQEDEEIIQARKTGWANLLKHEPEQWNSCPALIQKDDEVIQASKTGWIEKFRRDPKVWNCCPAILQTDFRHDSNVVQDLRAGWVDLLNCEPQQWNSCPAFLQKDDEVMLARKTGWIEKFRRNPRECNFCPGDLLNDPEIAQACRSIWVDLLKRDPQQWDFCPFELQKDPEVIEMRKYSGVEFLLMQDALELGEIPVDLFTAFLHHKNPLPPYASSCFAAVVEEPQATLSLVKERWRHSLKSERANAAKALAELRDHPWNYSVLPAEQQAHPLIQEVAAQGWANRIKEDAVFTKHVPELLLEHPTLKPELAAIKQTEEAAFAEQILVQVRKGPALSDERLDKLGIPASQKKILGQIKKMRLTYWKKAIKSDWQAWEQMPHSLRHDEGILTTMRVTLGPQIRQNIALWNELPDCYRQDPALQRVRNFACKS